MNDRRNGSEDEIRIPLMEVEYPSEESIQLQKSRILAAGIPERKTIWERILEIYWEPGIKAIFYQCGYAWLIMGMVYLAMIAGCILSWDDVGFRIFLSLMTCPLLYLVFSFISLWSEEHTAIIELKQTMRYSFTRLISLRMLYSSIVAIFLNILLLPMLQECPLQEICSIGAAGISSMFLFATLSLYLYHRTGGCFHLGIMILVWAGFCAGIRKYGDTLYSVLFVDLPVAVHLAAAVCCMLIFMKSIRKAVKKNAYA